jgi:hypothetical protein
LYSKSACIPSLHDASRGAVRGAAKVFIQSRQDLAHPGTFDIKIDVRFDPGVGDYPVLNTLVLTSQLSDTPGPPAVSFSATTVDLTNSYGKHNPTIYITGRCKVDFQEFKGCKYWVLIANNKPRDGQGTADIVGFAVMDRNGNRVAYGTGPVQAGDLDVIAPGV